MREHRPLSSPVPGLRRAACLVGALAVLVGCFGGRGGGVDKPTKTYLAQLKSKDDETRRNAVRMLAHRKKHVMAVAPALLEALDDEDPIVKKTAAQGLGMLLRNPELSDSRVVWEEIWRRAKARIDKEEDLSPQERLDREKAMLKNDEGVMQMARGNFQGAETLFLEAVTKDEHSAMAWNNLGKCNANQGRWPSAIERFHRAIEEDRGFASAHYNIADAYLEISKATGTDRTYEAMQYVERAIGLDRRRKDWASRWLKAKVLHFMAVREPGTSKKIDLYRRADEAADEAKRFAPDSPEVRNTAALIAYGRGLVYKAYKEVMEVDRLGYEIDPDFLKRLWPGVRRWYLEQNMDPPPMPESAAKKPVKGTAPALRMPYGPGSR